MKRVPRAQTTRSLFPQLGFGLGLRARHYPEILGQSSNGPGPSRPAPSWFEALTENFMMDGGRPLHVLEAVRAERPVVFHGVSLNIGSTDPLDKKYLARLKKLVDRFEPALVSDHLCWTGVRGRNLHDLLPLPCTREVASHVARRVRAVQDVLKRRILLENPSTYLTFTHSELSEWEFLSEIAREADCGILLDVNNVYVSAVNHGFEPEAYLAGLPAERIGQIHLAGHSVEKSADGSRLLIDTHDHPVCPEVWELYSRVVERFGAVSTMVEWDANIPEYAVLEAELEKARAICARVLEAEAPTARPAATASASAFAVA